MSINLIEWIIGIFFVDAYMKKGWKNLQLKIKKSVDNLEYLGYSINIVIITIIVIETKGGFHWRT